MYESPLQRNSEENIEGQDENLESARIFGQQYTELIGTVTGKTDRESFLNNPNLDPKIRQVAERAQSFQQQQTERQTEKNMDAHALLSQVFKSEAHQKALEDRGKYRMEEVSKGIYMVYLDVSLMVQLRRGSDATAAIIRDGISFILIPELKDPDQQKKNLAENIPHETHHLIWVGAGGQNAFPINEPDSDIAKSFALYRDELMARASSGGALIGYNHISKLHPSEREALEKESPGKADTITNRVIVLNELLEDLAGLLNRSDTYTKIDMLKTVAESSTFDEMEAGLKSFKNTVESGPLKPEQQTGAGWVTI